MDHATEAAAALKFILSEIAPASQSFSWEGLRRVDAPPNMPDTYLVRLALERHVGAEFDNRPYEKTAWLTAVSFRGRLVVITSEKFGLRLRTTEESDEELVRDLASVLERAVPQVERALQPEIEDQIRSGRITIPNNFHLFRNKYEYLRGLAESNYASEPPPPTVRGTVTTYNPFKPELEGFYAGTATLDAYFSWLEHVLVLLLPFSGFDANKDDLASLITESWTEKFKRVFDLGAEHAAKTVYERLLTVKEDYRNPSSHGGLDRSLSAFHVHVPGIGAIPARLSKTRLRGWFMPVIPVRAATFTEICAYLDQADALLKGGPRRLGYRFIAGGLDICFDPASVAMYEAALADPENFDEFLDWISYRQDAANNFEW